MSVAEDLEAYASIEDSRTCVYWARTWRGKRPCVNAGSHKFLTRGMSASRAVYVIAHSGIELPSTSWVLHTCGNGERGCVNPTHLYLGNGKDNAEDRRRDGRTARGARNGRSRLSAADVALIRDQLAAGVAQCDLAAAHGVSQVAISHIALGKTWR